MWIGQLDVLRMMNSHFGGGFDHYGLVVDNCCVHVVARFGDDVVDAVGGDWGVVVGH